MNTTNVRASDLNYHRYANVKYDRDIRRVIPFYEELHRLIAANVRRSFDKSQNVEILDLGVGTGLTSAMLQNILPKSHLEAVDFSRPMIAGARSRLSPTRTTFRVGDYSTMTFKKKFDLIITVIGFHHQTDKGKRRMIRRAYSLLKPGGLFIIGDLMTYRQPKIAALNQAKHFHHLVNKAADKKTLAEWAHHHLFLNQLAPVEDHVGRLRDAGFRVEVGMKKFNTVMLIKKNRPVPSRYRSGRHGSLNQSPKD